MPDAVIVTDMLRGFLEEGYPLFIGARARRIIPNIQALLERELATGAKVFYICDAHDPDDLEFKIWPRHCVAGTVEAEVIPELAKYPGETIPKKRYSGFYGTDLDARLKALKPDKLIICGTLTNICVLHTTANARNRDYDVEVPVDCVASNNEADHVAALEHIKKVLGARLTLARPSSFKPGKFEPSAAVLAGETADVYFPRTLTVLKGEGLNPVTTMEVFPTATGGIICGIEEVKALLASVLPPGSEVWSLAEGDPMSRREPALRITAPYQSYGLYETAVIGILAHCSGWATAARECVMAARGIPVVSFGSRHVHPNVAGVMDYSAIVGGCAGCSSVAGAKLAGLEPVGTMPHALILIMGDTVKATLAFDRHVSPTVRRVSLVDTLKDEVEDAIRVAQAMGDRLSAVRLDTPEERGRVTADLIIEVRAKLDLAGFKKVGVFVSGGLTPERITQYLQAGAPIDGLGVGSYISGARPIDFKGDLKMVDGRPVAKRGRLPGITPNPRLKRVI